MLWAVWGALAFCLLVLAVGGWLTVRTGLVTWRQLKALTALLGRGGDAISVRAEAAAQQAGGGGGDAAERLAAAVERLSRSTAYARLIAGSSGRAISALTGLRAAVPRK
jgi:hypothetical protein